MAKRPIDRIQEVREDRKRRNLMKKSIRKLLAVHATDVRARSADRPVPKPFGWHHRLVFPDVTASIPFPAEGVMAQVVVVGGSSYGSCPDSTSSSYQVIVRVETQNRLQEPEREEIWAAMASYARQTGGDFWIVAPKKLRERVKRLVTSSRMEEVSLPDL